MRKVREVLRLKHAVGLSYREISEATGVGKTAVGEYIRRAEAIGITWPVPDEIDDATLEQRMFNTRAHRRCLHVMISIGRFDLQDGRFRSVDLPYWRMAEAQSRMSRVIPFQWPTCFR
jgi:hypothetical protein